MKSKCTIISLAYRTQIFFCVNKQSVLYAVLWYFIIYYIHFYKEEKESISNKHLRTQCSAKTQELKPRTDERKWKNKRALLKSISVFAIAQTLSNPINLKLICPYYCGIESWVMQCSLRLFVKKVKVERTCI